MFPYYGPVSSRWSNIYLYCDSTVTHTLTNVFPKSESDAVRAVAQRNSNQPQRVELKVKYLPSSETVCWFDMKTIDTVERSFYSTNCRVVREYFESPDILLYCKWFLITYAIHSGRVWMGGKSKTIYPIRTLHRHHPQSMAVPCLSAHPGIDVLSISKATKSFSNLLVNNASVAIIRYRITNTPRIFPHDSEFQNYKAPCHWWYLAPEARSENFSLGEHRSPHPTPPPLPP